MSNEPEANPGKIIRSSEEGIVVRSKTLIDRGLQDIARLTQGGQKPISESTKPNGKFSEEQKERMCATARLEVALNRESNQLYKEIETAKTNPPPVDASYGVNNKVVTREACEAALADLRDIDNQMQHRWDDLSKAITTDDVQLVRAILKSDPWLLCKAARKGDVTIAEALLTHNAEIDARDAFGSTALICAAESGQPTMTAILITHGANVNAQNTSGRTALHQVLEDWQEDISEPKMIAVAVVNTIITLLLRGGADINLKDNGGRTPLDLELRSDRKEVVSLLSRHGAKSSRNI